MPIFKTQFFSHQSHSINTFFLLLLTVWLLSTPVGQLNAHEKNHAEKSQHFAQHVAFDTKGTLWRARVEHGFVLVDSSRDLAKTFSKSIKVNTKPQRITAHNEERPQIAIGPEGDVYVVWTESLKAPFSGYVWFARSTNQGKSFEKPYIVHQDRAEITHAFATLNVSAQGVVTVVWIDKRDLTAAKKSGQSYQGAAIYYAKSSDQGASFTTEKKLADASCECCRLATTNKPDGSVTVLWRAIFEGNERDHAIAEMPQNNAVADLHRASFGHWQIEGCPHHGSALAAGGAGEEWWGYHMAYYDGQDKKPGLYYARMDGEAWASSVPKRVGHAQHQAGHPALLSINEKVWLVWREINAGNYSIYGQYSDDDGKNWTKAKLLVQATDKTEKLDYPQLLRYENLPYLLVNNIKKGVQLIPMAEIKD